MSPSGWGSIILALALSSFASATLPRVDFNRMGHVGIAGSFAGLDVLDSSTSEPLDSSASTVLVRASDGTLSRLASTNPGGRISAGCALGDSFYIAGLFSSVNGTSASNIASYSPSTGAISALGSNGPNGEIKSAFCDTKNNKLWVGGTFTSPGNAVAVWDAKANSWSPPPFSGLFGAEADVLSITTNSSQSSLFFAGSFVVSFQGNGTVFNGTNNPNVPFSAGATPFTSSLVPIPLQGAEIDASPTTSEAGFNTIANILCPSGPDGPGASWLAVDGFEAVINVRDFAQISANGIRLGNTFQSGRSTTGFSVTSIPDNKVLTLTFVDPTTGQNQTCSDPCPLLAQTDIPFQDFLFPTTESITGFQLKLSEWVGSGPGLHLMQLLSSGAFASAVSSRNQISCFAPNASNVSTIGAWTESTVTTDIAGTVQDVLTARVKVGTSSGSAPSVTWMPYVSASGIYNVNMLIPGCTEFQDCPLRTSVKITLFPGGDLPPTVITVSQQNAEDVIQLLYSGPVFPSSPTFSTTVTMSLADQPEGTGVGGEYELVADRIDLQLLAVNFNTSGASGNGTGSSFTTSGQKAFGFFEWPLSSSSNVNTSQTLPTSVETPLDNIGLQLLAAAGGEANVATTRSVVRAVAHHSSGAVFVGGTFNFSSISNVVVYKNGNLSALSGGGLNGPVSSLLIEGDTLFVGGSFSDTPSKSTSGKLQGVAAYSINSDTWTPLQSGVNGDVTDLSFLNGQVQLVGNFSGAISGPATDGLAVWNTGNSTWANSGGFLIGNMTFVGNSTAPGKGKKQSQIVAGNVLASSRVGSSGFVLVSNGANGGNGVPSFTPLGVQLQSATQLAPVKRAKRSPWSFGFALPHLFARQSPSTAPPLPASPSAPSPAVLAGAFWTNTSNSHDVAILGGNFSIGSGTTGLASYDMSTGVTTPLPGLSLNGTVRALLVSGDSLFVGGDFTVQGNTAPGFVIYNLASQQLDISGLNALSASGSETVVVRSISTSSALDGKVIVAGTFSKAGNNACAGICELDIATKTWSSLGNGIQSGEVTTVVFGGDDQGILFASGSIVLAGNVVANVAEFSVSNSTWSAVGNGADIPGPVTALEVDNGNSSSIFAAGKTANGTFLSFWNGVSWSAIGANFAGDSAVAQMKMVPLQDTHSANGVVEQDRMLMISGSLSSSSFGNASSVLFDGQNFIPYFTAVETSGAAGFIYSLFASISNFSFNQRRVLAVGVVILISIAIAAGVVFFLSLLGIIWTLFSRRETTNPMDIIDVDDDDDSAHQRPSSLLEHINAATRTTILGGVTSPFEGSKEKEEEGGTFSSTHGHDPYAAQEQGDYMDSPVDAAPGVGSEQGRPAHARYSYDGTGEGELPLTVGMELEVLDDRDHAWWYARDVNTGREGVVPAAYLY